MEKVSIITPCYNGEKYVSSFLDSVLNQTYKNIELIFVDDGSTDDTKKIVKNYSKIFKEKNIEIIYIYQKNSGQSNALNNGLKHFTGEYLIWPDSDDILAKDSIEKRVNFLIENPKYQFVSSDSFVTDEKFQKIIRKISNENIIKNEGKIFEALIKKDVACTCGCYMLKSGAFLEINPQREIYTEKRAGQNYQMLLPMALKYRCGYLQEPLYTYMVRNNSHSHSNKDMQGDIDRSFSARNVIIETIKKMDLNSEDKKNYIEKIKKIFLKKNYMIALKYGDENLVEKYFSKLKENKSLNTLLRVHYFRKNPMVNKMFIVLTTFLKKIKNKLDI